MGVLIMTNYLAIIRKLDFVDLFKYGYFLLNHAVSFDGDVIAHKDDENLFKQVTSKMNLYEYSFLSSTYKCNFLGADNKQ